MSGGMATYMVVEPVFPWELRALLMHAANVGKPVSFTAQLLDNPEDTRPNKQFSVTVTDAQFTAPQAFDVRDEDGHIIQIKLPELGPVEFTVYT